MKKITIFLLVATTMGSSVVLTHAQRKRRTTTYRQPTLEELPRRPIDTLTTKDPETRIITFSNNTWEYYRPKTQARLEDELVYRHNWDTASIFSYRNIELADLPQVVEVKLVRNISDYASPIVGRVSSKYGPRRRTSHHGTDIPLRVGEPLYATFDGKVRYAKWNAGGYGYLTIIRHPNGLESWYGHQSKLNVQPGDYVKAGQIIGFGGNTGNSRGAHLHFELRYQDQSFDPEFIFDFETGQLRYQTFALEKSFFSIRSRASEILEEEDEEFVVPGSLLAEVNDSTVVKMQQKPKPPVASTAGAVYHTIVSGNTLGHLAAKYNVSIDQMCRLNGITRMTTLALGRKIRIK